MPISSIYFCQREKHEYLNLDTIGNDDALTNSAGAKTKSVILSYCVVFSRFCLFSLLILFVTFVCLFLYFFVPLFGCL